MIEEMQTGRSICPHRYPKCSPSPVRAALRPMLRFNYLSVVGLLDPRLRHRLRVGWSAKEERQLTRTYAMIRLAYRALPDRLTYFPLAYHARKHHQCLEQMKKRQQKSFAYHLPEAHSRR